MNLGDTIQSTAPVFSAALTGAKETRTDNCQREDEGLRPPGGTISGGRLAPMNPDPRAAAPQRVTTVWAWGSGGPHCYVLTGVEPHSLVQVTASEPDIANYCNFRGRNAFIPLSLHEGPCHSGML